MPCFVCLYYMGHLIVSADTIGKHKHHKSHDKEESISFKDADYRYKKLLDPKPTDTPTYMRHITPNTYPQKLPSPPPPTPSSLSLFPSPF